MHTESIQYISYINFHTTCTALMYKYLPTFPYFLSSVLGSLPHANSLQYVRQLGETASNIESSSGIIMDAHVTIGAGLPPIPPKLVAKIESGKFVDMAELLPDRWGAARSLAGDESLRAPKSRRRTVTTILEWVQCFSIYLTVIANKQPQRIPDLLAYQRLIIESQMEYQGEAWMGYDRRFRQRAMANPHISWSTIDTTLWNLAFAGKARVARCTHCFSLSHPSNQCEWAPDPIPSTNYHQASAVKSQPICRAWNTDSRPGCRFANCAFNHICWYCSADPQVTDKIHKGIFCPNHPRSATRRSQP